ncbi:uncharacterized protein JCM6883_000393 [Sporobolomyces salmoneus]|uniref:uncharacterized protein n=1 Tax=Sporobolomyces salmoneus TaxID=183962 RepID=UPI003181377E
MFSSIYSSLSGALGTSSVPSSTPSTPPHSPEEPSSLSTSQPRQHQAADSTTSPDSSLPSLEDLATVSAFYRKLVERNKHSPERLRKIRQEAIKDTPPREPTPDECCGEACGLECVTTVWWEEEKTWRDLHSDWRSIKATIAAEEEEIQRAKEEEEALNGGPRVEIGVDDDIRDRPETEDDVMEQITRGWKG